MLRGRLHRLAKPASALRRAGHGGHPQAWALLLAALLAGPAGVWAQVLSPEVAPAGAAAQGPAGAAAQGPAGAAASAVDSAAADRGARRTQIAQARAAAEAEHARVTATCAGRFQLTACLQDAQRQRRQSLDALRRETLALDEADRQARADQRLQAQARRQAERAVDATAGGSAAPAGHGVPRPPKAGAAGSAAAPAGAGPAEAPVPTASTPAAAPRLTTTTRGRPAGAGVQPQNSADSRAQARAQRTAAKQAAAASHAQAVQRRNAAREAQRPPAAGLPVPGQPASAVSASGTQPPLPAAKANPAASGARPAGR